MRGRIEIIADMLNVAVSGAKKTHLVYKANLNFNMIKGYIRLLDEKGYMVERDGMFYTTEQGLRALKHLIGATTLVS